MGLSVSESKEQDLGIKSCHWQERRPRASPGTSVVSKEVSVQLPCKCAGPWGPGEPVQRPTGVPLVITTGPDRVRHVLMSTALKQFKKFPLLEYSKISKHNSHANYHFVSLQLWCLSPLFAADKLKTQIKSNPPRDPIRLGEWALSHSASHTRSLTRQRMEGETVIYVLCVLSN